jgi:hypothetical protein
MTQSQQKLDATIRRQLGLPPCQCQEYTCPELPGTMVLRGLTDQQISRVLAGKIAVPRSARG